MSRFTDRELTAQEWSLMMKAVRDVESQILLLESRRVDPKMEIRSLPMAMFIELTDECLEEIKKGNEVTKLLVKHSREKKRGMREGKARKYARRRLINA